ncbi:unnamed protein product, partial [marine sediment metagenome]
MNRLHDSLRPLYEKEISAYVHDPWITRDDYIDILMDRDVKNIETFFSRHAIGNLSGEEKVKILKLLEMQRHSMLMYTSCGWFFDEITGIETIQIMYYAACAIQKARELWGMDFETDYMNILEQAQGNDPEFSNGKIVYQKFVQPAITDLTRVGAHYAVSSLFTEYPETISLFCYTASSKMFEHKTAGNTRLAIGKAQVYSHITWEEKDISFAILH